MHAYTLKPIIAAHGIDYWQYLGLMSLDIMWIECVVERFHFFYSTLKMFDLCDLNLSLKSNFCIVKFFYYHLMLWMLP